MILNWTVKLKRRNIKKKQTIEKNQMMSQARSLIGDKQNAHKQLEEQQHAPKAAWYEMNIFSLIPKMGAAIADGYKNR